MKLSRLNRLLLLLSVLFLSFLSGWFLRGRTTLARQPYTVTVSRPDAEPAPTPLRPAAPGLLEGEIININTASAADLARLPGIGEKRAADILSWRAANGPFSFPEDLAEVPGIGPGTLEGLIDYITTE
ncbi:MAG: ComEA family DNA-binding protein [Clostridiales bacterium]|nr:ComEA family DNA-binding protein [Clostridiales bacterium]